MDDRLTIHNSQSKKHMKKAEKVLPGGIGSSARKFPIDICWSEGEGSKVYDVDGNEYVDYICGWGPIILGHCDDDLNEYITSKISEADLFGIGSTPLEIKAAEAIVNRVPSAERVIFGMSGSEVVAHAIRLARAVTGRSKVIKFQGLYHGWYDTVAANTENGVKRPTSDGVLPKVLDDTIILPYNELDSFERTIKENNDIAAVIMEPVAHDQLGLIPGDEAFLNEVRDITRSEGIILIFDEIISGFRYDLGGVQKLVDVIPDLTTFGKAIANGFPASVLCGRKEYMDNFDSTDKGKVMGVGTFNGNTTSVSAIIGTIKLLEERDVHDKLIDNRRRITDAIEDIIEDLSIDAFVQDYQTDFLTYFMNPPLHNHKDLERNNFERYNVYRKEMINHGILMSPGKVRRNYLTGAHNTRDVELTIEAAKTSLKSASEV